MSTFAELPPQLFLLGNVMRTGLILGGTSYLQDMLLPMNLSDAWLAPLLDKLESVKRQGWLVNDVYALQNLMESFLDFKPLTPRLHEIKIPTTVMSVVQTQVSWFGEGDDLFYIDGAKNPQILGTGSEDYFNDAWGLRDSTGPWTGTPITEGEKLGSRLSAYRWHIPDPIPFKTSLWAGIEHAGWTANPDGSVRSGFEQRPDFFSSVAFWYQKGVNEGLPEPPYGYDRLPFGNATQVTVENSIQDVTSEHGKTRVLKEVDWEKDLLYFEAEGPGARVNIPIDIPESGRYELIGLLAQGPNYGDYSAVLDGEPMNLDKRQPSTSEIPLPGPDILYGYLPELYVARDWSLGMADLTKGRHTLTFVCAGRDSHSSGYALGINDVVLEKMPDVNAAASEDDRPSPGKVNTGVVYRGHPLDYYLAGLKSATGSIRTRYIEVPRRIWCQWCAGRSRAAGSSCRSRPCRPPLRCSGAGKGRHDRCRFPPVDQTARRFRPRDSCSRHTGAQIRCGEGSACRPAVDQGAQ